MTKVEFLFDFGSPNAYFCHRAIPAIEQSTGVKFTYVPILLGGVFKATGNRSPFEAFAGIKNKNDYDGLEIKRFCEDHGITDFRSNPHFPINTLALMRGAVAAQKIGVFEKYVNDFYRYMWVEERNLNDPAEIARALTDSGFDAKELFALTQDPEIKQTLVDNTSDAVARGVFGSPTFFVDDDIYFGKDRLHVVVSEIEKRRAKASA